jgi:hypothetical protein
MVFDVEPGFAPASSDTTTSFDIAFAQGIPKPFCNDGTQLVWVQSLGRTIYGDVTEMLFTQFSAGQHDAYSESETCAPAP